MAFKLYDLKARLAAAEAAIAGGEFAAEFGERVAW
jgi:hypothetical protein